MSEKAKTKRDDDLRARMVKLKRRLLRADLRGTGIHLNAEETAWACQVLTNGWVDEK